MASTIEQLRQARNEFRLQHKDNDNINGVGISLGDSDNGALKVNLIARPKDFDSLPNIFNGIPVRYDVVGIVKAFN